MNQSTLDSIYAELQALVMEQKEIKKEIELIKKELNIHSAYDISESDPMELLDAIFEKQ